MCAIVQGTIIATHEHPGRQMAFDGFVLTVPMLLQTVFAPLLGSAVAEAMADKIAYNALRGGVLLATIVVGALAAAFVISAARRVRGGAVWTGTLSAAWFGTATLNVIGAIGNSDLYLSGGRSGGRYYFVGAIAFVLLVAIVAGARQPLVRRVAHCMLICMVGAGAWQVVRGDWMNPLIAGSPWRDEVRACGAARPCVVKVWPENRGAWSFTLVHR